MRWNSSLLKGPLPGRATPTPNPPHSSCRPPLPAPRAPFPGAGRRVTHRDHKEELWLRAAHPPRAPARRGPGSGERGGRGARREEGGKGGRGGRKRREKKEGEEGGGGRREASALQVPEFYGCAARAECPLNLLRS